MKNMRFTIMPENKLYKLIWAYGQSEITYLGFKSYREVSAKIASICAGQDDIKRKEHDAPETYNSRRAALSGR